MLSQLKKLSLDTEGRYATDAELEVLTEYIQSFEARLKAYQALQAAEADIIQETLTVIDARHPDVFKRGGDALRSKWKNDTARVLRYTAVAALMNDPETLRERFLLWFQTIMRAFSTQQSCDITYNVMQNTMVHHLTPESITLVRPYMELNRQVLGQTE